MFESKENRLNAADKDLICQFIDVAYGRVIKRDKWGTGMPIPQGVSVFMRHKSGALEYMFTKSEKYPVVKDPIDTACEWIDSCDPEEAGIYLYLNECMLRIASKHRRFSY